VFSQRIHREDMSITLPAVEPVIETFLGTVAACRDLVVDVLHDVRERLKVLRVGAAHGSEKVEIGRDAARDGIDGDPFGGRAVREDLFQRSKGKRAQANVIGSAPDKTSRSMMPTCEPVKIKRVLGNSERM
jgi:hypothetical protein